MSVDISRRTLAKGAGWSVPAVAVATAAPAIAASCTPKTVSASAAVNWVSTQTDFSTDDGDPEHHTVLYTFTNNGPDQIATGAVFDIKLQMEVLEGEEANVAVEETSSNVTATARNEDADDGDNLTDSGGARIVTTEVIAVHGTFTVSVVATYGALSNSGVDESVAVQSPAMSTDTTTCTTTDTALTIDGASDGTSYTSVS